ncbi:tim-barrel fold metal-dependent hydrolase [Halogeometricum borinquense DSM 11551]|uniref:Tim-barrel fold metal-dependent hydrolase n=2 Tax=Halogeometricum borinquense TaxID=60847 RepID=E4NRF4_HALBP|nr:amidohydrolase family protein [Halogeometricum borinquense]ADQ67995.1 predicted TIM-barrel fold metal-dependent hydrolase [Halogeometricum borinquense DSM 11551]ELY24084.1 tim-barrel fold metal-dependent hydrolase [Halogeometricum borinquense DSM 11551]RYJ13083.1 amidohydrolase [Halogeometricum borinquense]
MLELNHGFRVVDLHARLDPDSEEAVATRGREISAERLERELHQAGVVCAVVSPGRRTEGEGYLRANNAVARMSVDRPFVAFARINGPRDPSGRASARLRNLTTSRDESHADPEDIEQYAYDDRFHGFTLAPAVDGLPDEETLDQLENVGLPTLVHVGEAFTPDDAVETLLDRDFPVIFAGFGGYPLNRDLMHRSIDLLDEYDDLYVDTSYVRFRGVMERALLEHPDRVMFGSGAPEAHPNVGVMELLTLDVSEDAMRRAFSKNAARVVTELGPGEQ